MDNLDNESGAIESSAPSEAVEQASPEPVQETEQQTQPESQQAQVSEPPFHEHPRWKEVMESRRQDSERLKTYETQMAELRGQLQAYSQQRAPQKPEKPGNPLVDRLKGIDPEFGKDYEELRSLRDEFTQLRDWKQQVDRQNLINQAVTKVNTLYDKNKVADELKPVYGAWIENRALNTPNAKVEDLDAYFKEIHTYMTQHNESLKRNERASYVTAKKGDATPASQSGGVAMIPAKPKVQISKEQAIAQIAKEMRAAKNQE